MAADLKSEKYNAFLFYKVEASSKIHENLKKKIVENNSDFNSQWFSSKIFKNCTVLGVHKSIDNEIITIFMYF